MILMVTGKTSKSTIRMADKSTAKNTTIYDLGWIVQKKRLLN